MSIAHCILTYLTHILPSVQYSADELAIHIDIDSYNIFFKATFFSGRLVHGYDVMWYFEKSSKKVHSLLFFIC